jgi:hypothetical protein
MKPNLIPESVTALLASDPVGANINAMRPPTRRAVPGRTMIGTHFRDLEHDPFGCAIVAISGDIFITLVRIKKHYVIKN